MTSLLNVILLKVILLNVIFLNIYFSEIHPKTENIILVQTALPDLYKQLLLEQQIPQSHQIPTAANSLAEF